MRLYSCNKAIIGRSIIGLLIMMAALVSLDTPEIIKAQSSAPFIVEATVIINGRPAPDGSKIIAYIGGPRRIEEAHTQGGTFVMTIPEQPGQRLAGRSVEFARHQSDGTVLDFAQKTVWAPGGRVQLRLELNTESGSGGRLPQRSVPPFVAIGNVVVNGKIPPDGTRIAAYISGRRMNEVAHILGGRFKLSIPHHGGQLYDGQIVKFQALFKDGNVRDFPQTVAWQPGGVATVDLRHGPFKKPGQPRIQPKEPSSPRGISIPQIPQLPDGIDIGCVMDILGRIPSSLQDINPEDNLRITRECSSGRRSRDDSSRQELDKLRLGQEKLRLEQELAFQKEQQRLEAQRLKQEQSFQEEQQRLDAERRNQNQERIEREQALREEQDRLDRDRLMSDRERQEEQARLDQERLEQEQNRFQAEQEMRMEQQRLNQRRAVEEQQRQDELEKAKFESELARIERERSLEEERARLDQERLKRDDERSRQEWQLKQNQQGQGPGGQPPNSGDPDQRPGGESVNTGPTRGFFTNSQIGQLGSVNQLLDPATLAVIGILITLAASTLQLVKGN